jgi:heptose I phosphotransferase
MSECTGSTATSSQFVSLDEGRLIVAAPFLATLKSAGLDSFERVMAFTGGETKRDFPGRRTVRLEAREANGVTRGFYLKRYQPGYLSAGRRWLRRLGWPSAQDEAMREWNGLQRISALGLRIPVPVAFGQQRSGGVVSHSFLITAEVAGGLEGDRHLRSLPRKERGPFLKRVAALTRTLHGSGWVHKDLYLSHVLVAPSATDPGAAGAQLVLIDLQRVMKPCCWLERWRVKDLSALAYSALKSGAGPRELLAAFLVYQGTPRLEPEGRRLVRQVLKRVAWLKTRTPRHDKDFEQLK